jgi:hypothetical protein
MIYFKSIPDLKGNIFVEIGWIPFITEMKLRRIEWYKIIQRPRNLIYLLLRSIHWVLAPINLLKLTLIIIGRKNICCMKYATLEYGIL